MDCEHEKAHDPAAEWPDDVLLEHFDKCLKDDERTARWGEMREQARAGFQCLLLEHRERIQYLERVSGTTSNGRRLGMTGNIG